MPSRNKRLSGAADAGRGAVVVRPPPSSFQTTSPTVVRDVRREAKA